MVQVIEEHPTTETTEVTHTHVNSNSSLNTVLLVIILIVVALGIWYFWIGPRFATKTTQPSTTIQQNYQPTPAYTGPPTATTSSPGATTR